MYERTLAETQLPELACFGAFDVDHAVADAAKPAVPRVFLGDEDPISHGVLGGILRATPHVDLVGCAESLGEPHEWPLERVDVAVLSVGPQDDPTPLVMELTLRQVAVLLVGVGWTRARVDRAIAAGATGVLVKAARLAGLISAVLAVAAGHTVLSPELRRLWWGPREGASADGPLEGPGEWGMAERALESLTSREREVLGLLSTGMTTQDAAEALNVSASTVKSHISHTLAKLGVRNRLEAVLLAQGARRPATS